MKTLLSLLAVMQRRTRDIKVQGQDQGLDYQGIGQDQGLDYQGQGQNQGLDYQGQGQGLDYQ